MEHGGLSGARGILGDMNPTDAATALFKQLQSFIGEAQKLPQVNHQITSTTTTGAANLNRTVRGSSAYLAIAARVADELAGPERAMGELAATFERQLEGVTGALDELEAAMLGRQLAVTERSYVSDMVGTLEVFIEGYAVTARPGIECLVVAADGGASELPGGLSAVIGRIADHATAILMMLDVVSSWGPRARALGAKS